MTCRGTSAPEVKRHAVFRGVDFGALEARAFVAPRVPRGKAGGALAPGGGGGDTSNYTYRPPARKRVAKPEPPRVGRAVGGMACAPRADGAS